MKNLSKAEISKIAKKWKISPGEVEVIAELGLERLKLLRNYAERLAASARADLENSQDIQKIYKAQGVVKAYRRLFGEIEQIMEDLKNG